jgi:multiple sugar transport system ATP-binding protein
MVFQNYALYPHMTVAENMGFALKLKKARPADTSAKVEKAASILGLEALLDRFPRQLSGGQRQRVAMGRALVRDPQVFLFDEPLSNLDAKLRVQMRGEIKSMHQRIGTTTIYVTHDQVEAMTMADKIVVLHGGFIEQIGAPLDLYDRPANLFVAGFIGSPSMNFIDGKIEEGVFRSDKGLALPLPAGLPVAQYGGRALVYGIRPEHIRAINGGLPGKVEIVEGTGSEIYAKIDCRGQQISCLFRERLDIRFGETVAISIDANSVHLFDKTSGKRL